MEGHLFHVYSHVYTLNNLYAENMTVRCMHPAFRHIQQKHSGIKTVSCIMASFVCAHLSLCLIVVNAPLCECVCVCVVSVCKVFFPSHQCGLKRKAFLKSGCVRQQQSLTISLSNTFFICVNSQCPPSSKILWLLCYVTSTSLLATQQSVCSVICEDGCMFVIFFP